MKIFTKRCNRFLVRENDVGDGLNSPRDPG